jgi:diacylglycerol kinase (ATP)
MAPLTDRPKPTGLIRLWRAFGNTAKGYIGAFREEAAFRQELALCVLLFPVGLWLGEDGIEPCWSGRCS